MNDAGRNTAVRKLARVVVVDDHPFFRDGLSRGLRQSGYLDVVGEAGSGREGLELIPQVRAYDPSLPIVVMTGWGSVETAVEAMRLGGKSFVQKPWEDVTLLEIVQREIEDAQASKRRDANQLGEVVVVHIGSNGAFSEEQFKEMMEVLADVHRVVFVNVKVPRPWEQPNNAVLADGVQ